MAKITFKCSKCENKKIIEFNPGEKIETPKCCNEDMKREFKIGKGNSMDNQTFDIARMMSYHASK